MAAHDLEETIIAEGNCPTLALRLVDGEVREGHAAALHKCEHLVAPGAVNVPSGDGLPLRFHLSPANGFPARLLPDLIVLSSRYVVYHES